MPIQVFHDSSVLVDNHVSKSVSFSSLLRSWNGDRNASIHLANIVGELKATEIRNLSQLSSG